MIKITLPEHLADQAVVAGVKFVDGVANVPRIGASKRRYFGMVGATITDVPEPSPEVPDTDAEKPARAAKKA